MVLRPPSCPTRKLGGSVLLPAVIRHLFKVALRDLMGSTGPRALIEPWRQASKDGDRQPLGLVTRFSSCVEHGGATGSPYSSACWLTPSLHGVGRRKAKPAVGGGQEWSIKDAAKGQKDV